MSAQSKRTLRAGDAVSLPLNQSLPKTASPLPSPPSHPSPASPQGQAGPPTQTVSQKGDAKGGEEPRERGRGLRQGGGVGRDPMEDQREKAKEEEPILPPEEDGSAVIQKEQEVQTGREEEQMEVTEEGQRAKRGKEKKMEEEEEEEEEEGETAMDQSENLTIQNLHQCKNTDPVPTPDAVKESSMDPKPIQGLISAPAPVPAPVPAPTPAPAPVTLPVPAQAPVPAPAPVTLPAPVPVTHPVPAPVPAVSVQTQRLPESMQPVLQEDFCENMSTQSDNQSGTFICSFYRIPYIPVVLVSDF
ncbi:alpha-protein kinase 3-like [Etheostoma cragini]|uniref:alpha-protein kinase 3-like n=1 Tax=Etheostoma cragini TaxID=417921 RepID=UPI00155E7023|nr:alpha-protein kinase 3-like [Etheostoma cragini]